ncbi:DnaB-like helicase C-terminal domain-containing protein [uncultured Ruegeria sp.]|uniref:DnaB-like helicase C-terminal domain-containing protein n=1 Tax=uncultured Ruegeria sp. TaxID=259304 RepID=UPI00262C32C5|nr:DnaB-like helicase C-terminal domain-containing protein [uncultured Ruegeria sp.]
MKKITEFSPNFPLLKAIRFSNSANLSDLCAIANLDPSVDFKVLSISDIDFRGSDLADFVVSSDLPDHLTAQQMKELVDQFAVDQDSGNKNEPDTEIEGTFEVPKQSEEQGFKSFSSSVANAVEATGFTYSRAGQAPLIPTGFADLDFTLGGLRKAQLFLLAAVPSAGKTAFATQLAKNIADRVDTSDASNDRALGGVVGYFSLQQSAEQIAQRILAVETEIKNQRILQGDMTEEEFRRFVNAAKGFEDTPIYINDTSSNIEDLVKGAEKLKEQHGLDVLFVDMLDDFSVERPSSAKFKNEIAENLKVLKVLARRLDICVFVVSSLSQSLALRSNRRPTLNDLDDPAAVSQIADTVLLLHREEFFLEQETPEEHDFENLEIWRDRMERTHGKVEVIVAKHRNGPMGTVELAFDADLLRFGNQVKPWQESNLEDY